MNEARMLRNMQDDLSDVASRLDDIAGFLATLSWVLGGLDSLAIFVIKVDNLQKILKGQVAPRTRQFRGIPQ